MQEGRIHNQILWGKSWHNSKLITSQESFSFTDYIHLYIKGYWNFQNLLALNKLLSSLHQKFPSTEAQLLPKNCYS